MTETLLYLYGIVPGDAPDPPAELRGVEDGGVRVVRMEGIAAVVSEVPGDVYAGSALDARLEDLPWVGERGLAHERVLDWFAERGPAVPLSLFSLHRDEERLRERLAADGSRLAASLERLRGRREWGVKLWRDEEKLSERLEELSPPLRQLAKEIEEAAPGRAFLLSRKRDALRAEELRRVSARVTHLAYAELAQRAAAAVNLPLPPPAGSGRALALHAAFLVDEGDAFTAFQRRLGELARELAPVGVDFEFTGPWPAYHFAEPDGA